MKTNKKTRVQTSKFEKVFIPASLAGLSRSHNMIRIEREKEIQFLKLCSQIRIKDIKKDRADNQRDQRKLKRDKKHSTSNVDTCTVVSC
jgi:CRISPR/Cas system-associated endoribonuclease Cas2